MLDRLPEITYSLLAHIPRLEEVREVLRHSPTHARGSPASPRGAMPLGARILRAALDFDDLVCRGLSKSAAVERLTERGETDAEILKYLQGPTAERRKRDFGLKELRAGLVFAEDVKNRAGLLLVARGQTVTVSIIERLRNLAPRVGMQEPLVCYETE
jgi:hypothetical protein